MDIPTQYCEFGFWGLNEPLYVLTSLFFIVFAFLAYRKTNKIVLPILLGLIGICSSLWHFNSLPWADLLDTLSITIFSLVLTAIIFYRVFTNKFLAICGLVLFAITAFFVEQISILNGSLVYVLLFLLLLFIGHRHIKLFPSSKKHIKLALLIFGIAILFRIVDPVICDFVSTGTHFVWHILMAIVGYNLILGLQFKKL